MKSKIKMNRGNKIKSTVNGLDNVVSRGLNALNVTGLTKLFIIIILLNAAKLTTK